MGFLLTKSNDTLAENSVISPAVVKVVEPKSSLYKSLDSFAWKDTSKRDKKESAINAYKRLAF